MEPVAAVMTVLVACFMLWVGALIWERINYPARCEVVFEVLSRLHGPCFRHGLRVEHIVAESGGRLKLGFFLNRCLRRMTKEGRLALGSTTGPIPLNSLHGEGGWSYTTYRLSDHGWRDARQALGRSRVRG